MHRCCSFGSQTFPCRITWNSNGGDSAFSWAPGVRGSRNAFKDLIFLPVLSFKSSQVISWYCLKVFWGSCQQASYSWLEGIRRAWRILQTSFLLIRIDSPKSPMIHVVSSYLPVRQQHRQGRPSTTTHSWLSFLVQHEIYSQQSTTFAFWIGKTGLDKNKVMKFRRSGSSALHSSRLGQWAQLMSWACQLDHSANCSWAEWKLPEHCSWEKWNLSFLMNSTRQRSWASSQKFLHCTVFTLRTLVLDFLTVWSKLTQMFTWSHLTLSLPASSSPPFYSACTDISICLGTSDLLLEFEPIWPWLLAT